MATPNDVWESLKGTFNSGVSAAGTTLKNGAADMGRQAIADFFHTPSGQQVAHDTIGQQIGNFIIDNWKIIAVIILIIIFVVMKKR